jgi:hypothetical protein
MIVDDGNERLHSTLDIKVSFVKLLKLKINEYMFVLSSFGQTEYIASKYNTVDDA